MEAMVPISQPEMPLLASCISSNHPRCSRYEIFNVTFGNKKMIDVPDVGKYM